MSYSGLLTDTCTIVRRTQGAFNAGTGQHASPADTTVYSGPCRITSQGGGGRTTVAEEAVVERSPWVFLPLSATGVKVEDVVKITASENADVVNREMIVKDTAAEFSPVTSEGARWLVCEDILEGV